MQDEPEGGDRFLHKMSLKGSGSGHDFKSKGRAEVYAWVARTLRQQRYSHQDRAAKGLLWQYLAKMAGLSRAQLTRLIQQYRQGRGLQPSRYRRHRFASKYTPADVELLAALDDGIQRFFQRCAKKTGRGGTTRSKAIRKLEASISWSEKRAEKATGRLKEGAARSAFQRSA